MREYKTNSIFKPDDTIHLNACVGDNGGPYNYFDYALGYFGAGRAVLHAVVNHKLEVDIAVYPMVYNFRHAVELTLKHLAEFLPKVFGSKGLPQPTHDLGANWRVVIPYLHMDDAFEAEQTIPAFEETVKDLTHFDPLGEVFRFPENRSGDPHLTDAAIINLGVVGEALIQAAAIAEHWNNAAEVLWQDRLESRQ